AHRLLLRAQDLKSILQRYLDRLRQHRDALNRLNVYPVPDGDTGTNMTLTLESVMDEVRSAETMDQVATALAHGSLMGAQGNSGIILSQILAGLANAFRGSPSLGTAQLVDALGRASVAAYRAVGRPVEGTILTVLREAAEAAQDADTPEGEDLAAFLLRIYQRAEDALNSTPDLLPVLKEAGVVDAGGAGFLLLLVAFLEEVTGEDVVLPEAIFRAAAAQLIPSSVDPDHSVALLRYEVMFLLYADDPAAGDQLRDSWADMGDSIVVVGSEGVWNCHIHTDDVGPAVEAGIALGRPERIKITDLLDQAAEEAFHRAPSFSPLPEFAVMEVGVVAVAVGDGIVELFRDAGAQGLVVGGQTMNPSVREMLAVVDSTAANTVIVLPNNKNIIPVAEQLDALSSKRVLVVPTRSVPEGLAAMIAYLPGADPDDLVKGMTSAAGSVAWGEVTRAVRDAVTPVGACVEGDWLGVIGGEVALVEHELAPAATRVMDALVAADADMITILTGSDADDATTAALVSHLADGHPEVEVAVIDGGQPLYPYMFGVE
ncbi:MAG: DAK2 domain-containing protein, partial [Acidimicrobiia bacterium]